MCSLPRTTSAEALGVQVETETRRTVAPVTRRKSGCDQASGRTTEGQLVAAFDDAIGMWYTRLSSITGHHEFLAGANEFLGIVRIEYLNFSTSYKLLDTVNNVHGCFGWGLERNEANPTRDL